MADDPVVIDWVRDLVLGKDAMRLLGYRTLAKARKGVEPTEQAILKVMGSESGQAANLALVESIGAAAPSRASSTAPVGGRRTCAASPAPSPAAPARSNATSSPKGSSGSRGSGAVQTAVSGRPQLAPIRQLRIRSRGN